MAIRFFECSFDFSNDHSKRQDEALKDFRAIIHAHSYLSHDSKGTFEEIAKAAKEAGVRAVFMTDHPSESDFLSKQPEGIYEGILFFRGSEAGNLLAIDIKEQPTGSLAERIASAKKQGGLAFIAHSEQVTDWRLGGFEGMEIYNIHTNFTEVGLFKAAAAVAKMKNNELLFVSFLQLSKKVLAAWDRLTQDRKVVGISANDAHQNLKIGSYQLDPYARMFKFVSTHILARRLDKVNLIEGLRSGHCYVSFDVFGDPTGFSFRAGKANMGDSVAFARNLELSVRAPKKAAIRLLRNGREVALVNSNELSHRVTASGVYRVEMYTLFNGDVQPWILSNPIYVESAGEFF